MRTVNRLSLYTINLTFLTLTCIPTFYSHSDQHGVGLGLDWFLAGHGRSRLLDIRHHCRISTAVASCRRDRHTPQALTFLGGARFIAWHLKHPFLREWWRGSPGVSELRPCPWTHLNLGLVPYSLIWWWVWQIEYLFDIDLSPAFLRPLSPSYATIKQMGGHAVISIHLLKLFSFLFSPNDPKILS